MNCNCFEKIKEALTKHHGENSDVELELKQTIILRKDAEDADFGLALAPLYYTYQPPKGKRKKSYVTFNFCPFCGKKNQ